MENLVMTASTLELSFTKEDYYSYSYFENISNIISPWLRKHLKDVQENQSNFAQIIEQHYIFLTKKNYIDEKIWNFRHQVDKNLKEIKFLKDSNLIEQEILLGSQIDSSTADEFKKNITHINLQRVYFGTIRNMYTFFLRYTHYLEYMEKLNTFNSLLASYLYGLRLSTNMYILMTIDESINLTPYEKAKGYFNAHYQQIFNDILWVGILLGATLNVYTQDPSIKNAYAKDSTAIILNWVFILGLTFDVINAYQSLDNLEKDWETFKKKMNDIGKEIPQQLEDSYLAQKKECIEHMNYLLNVLITNLCLAVLNIFNFIEKDHQNVISQQFAVAIPYLQILITLVMFAIHIQHITRKRWDEDFKKLPLEEQEKINREAMIDIMREMTKVIVLALVVFLLASQIGVAGIPGMIILGIIIAVAIHLINTIADYVKKIEPNPQDDTNASLLSANTQEGH